jgi:hypothetical protein
MRFSFPHAAAAGTALLVVLFVCSCAPVNLYTVNMGYLPPETAIPPTGEEENITITVAQFTDARDIDDTMRLGAVILSDGKKIPVLPKKRRPAETVTDSVKKCLSRKGYFISSESPAWDLQSKSIDKLWGTALLIGGTIDQLEVICHKDTVKKTYETNVKLSIVFADLYNAKILRSMEAAATSSLVHVTFSEEMLGEQISQTLSKAIRQVCGDGKTIPQIIEQMARER